MTPDAMADAIRGYLGLTMPTVDFSILVRNNGVPGLEVFVTTPAPLGGGENFDAFLTLHVYWDGSVEILSAHDEYNVIAKDVAAVLKKAGLATATNWDEV